jgi:hypothetical protein
MLDPSLQSFYQVGIVNLSWIIWKVRMKGIKAIILQFVIPMIPSIEMALKISPKTLLNIPFT